MSEWETLPGSERAELALRFSVIGSEARLSILEALAAAGPGGLSLGELAAKVGVAGSTLTHHMRLLIRAGLAHRSRAGKRVLCRATDCADLKALSDHLLRLCHSPAA